MRWASALRWPWLVMGSVPPVDSMTISDQKTPVEMWTDAIFDMAMLSSLLPNRRDLTRATRCGLMMRRVGKKKLPWVQRLALKVSAGEESIGLSGSVGMRFFCRAFNPCRDLIPCHFERRGMLRLGPFFRGE